MSKISELIDESIASVIQEDNITNSPATRFFKKLTAKKVVGNEDSGIKNAAARHTAENAAEVKKTMDNPELASVARHEREGLLSKLGSKVKGVGLEIDEKIKEHPYLAATTAAALAAGLGGLAAVKKMRKAAVKGKKK